MKILHSLFVFANKNAHINESFRYRYLEFNENTYP